MAETRDTKYNVPYCAGKRNLDSVLTAALAPNAYPRLPETQHY